MKENKRLNYETTATTSVAGTSFMGYITTDYSTLVRVFGTPTITGSRDGKFQVEWVIFIENILYTIYDYKETQPVADITEWHIGGKQGSPWLAQYLVKRVVTENK